MHIRLDRSIIRRYNTAVRGIAEAHSAQFGLDTEVGRQYQARWCKRVRREYPLRDNAQHFGAA